MPYIVRHEASVMESNPKMTKNRMLKEPKMNFVNQFNDTIFCENNASETLRKLVDGPKRNVIT